MIFETACDDFLVLREPIENMLLQTSKKSDLNDSTSIFVKDVNVLLVVMYFGSIVFYVIIFIVISILSPPGSDDISDKLALDWTLVINHGEIYRLLTCMFVHAEIDHIYNNMIVL